MKRININTATAKELTQLAGIGKAIAARIVAHREAHGAFTAKKDLIHVQGVSESMIEALINRVVLSSSSNIPTAQMQPAANGHWKDIVLSTAETLRAQDLALQQTRHTARRRKKGKEPSKNFRPQPVKTDVMFNTELRAIAAKGLGVPADVMEAVYRVVSRKKGFVKEGRPPVTFMGHVFWQQLKKRGIKTSALQRKFKSILYPSWDPKAVRKGVKEYKRVKRAMRVHPDVALRSSCWGMFQVPGFHYKRLGYENVYDFVKQQQSSEVAQLKDFLRVLAHPKVTPHLQQQDWEKFARRYFGAGYEQMRMHKKLAKAFRKIAAPNESSD